MKKPILARALALVMSLSLLSTTALAHVVTIDGVEGSKEVETVQDGVNAIAQSESRKGSIQLTDDAKEHVTIKDLVNVTIDLNGNDIDGSERTGSVIQVTGSSSLTLTDTSEGSSGTITGGNATFGGGVNVSDGSTFTMNGGTISDNTAKHGGGVYIKDGSTFEMEGGKISGNIANSSGGGVFVSNYSTTSDLNQAPSQFIMNKGEISGNTAGGTGSGAGGGIAAYGDKQENLPDPVIISGGTIKGNKTGGDGAGVAVQNSGIIMTGGTVSGNAGSNLGGGLYVYDSSANISNATFTGNSTSANAMQGQGGGIYLIGATGTIEKTTIGGIYGTDQNSARTGGGIYVGANSNITLDGNGINNNKASGNGGGVYVYNATAEMTGNTISGNDANQGGGIYAYGSNASVTMKDGSVTNNTAGNVGGGVRLHGGAKFTMTGGEIHSNSAGTHSDDIYSNASTLILMPAGSMNIIGADGKPITGWYYDGTDRYGNGKNAYLAQNHATRENGYTGTLCLKAAHDQYFSVMDGDGNELANVEKGTVLNLNEDIAAPTLDGYEFIGWVLGNEVVESVTVTEEITLGSLWRHVDHNTATRVENEVPAQIGVEGSYEEVTYCTVCGEELNRITVTTPALEPEEPENPEEPGTPEEPGVTIPDADVPLAGAPDAGEALSIEDEEVPLAGIVTLAELLAELREHEEIPEAELPEDFKFIDHDYAQAIYWALAEQLVEDTEDDPLDPDELVTAGLLREVLERFVAYCKGYEDFVVTVEGEDDELVMDLGERLTAFYAELEEYEAEAEAA